MPYDIILGRDKSDKVKFGNNGLIYLGKGYVTMGNYTSLSNKILMDVARSHVILVAGKRGSGKSYSIATIAEELSTLPPEISANIAPLIFDTMGIFWTMKYENKKEQDLLDKWSLKTREIAVRVFIPHGKSAEYSEKKIPFDEKFALSSSELSAEDWLSIFNLEMTSKEGTIITSIISNLKSKKQNFSLNEIFEEINKTSRADKESIDSVNSLFSAADEWGIFSKETEGTKITDLIKGGQTTILDLSTYSSIGAFNVRAMLIGIISRKLFEQRMEARKKEELQSLNRGQDYLSYATKRDNPLIWLFIDEAQEFLPRDGKTPATEALVQLLREGRQPGISMVLATQQPGKIHTDVMTQSDIVIAHRITSEQDIKALNEIMQSYVYSTIQQKMDELPDAKGSAIVLDDNSERIYSIQVRPRFTWHGGESPSAVKAETKL
ncbi:MAG: DUF87 domain-containing protein [Nanoarchaeota archaeon]